MALTQISTAGVKDDAVTSGKIPANAVGSSEIAANAVGTSELAANAVTNAKIGDTEITGNKLADQAVSLDKLPHGTSSNDGKFLRANNGADPSFESVPSPAITAINNATNNRVVTSEGGTTVNAESNLTFTGSNLSITNSGGASELTLVTPNNTDGGVYFNDGSNSGAIAYQHNDNSMRFRVNATEKMRIDYTGKVGIGETAPDGDLHIKSSNPAIYLEDSTNSSQHGQAIIEQNGDNLKIRQDAGNASSGTDSNISFQVDAAERVKVANLGDNEYGLKFLNSKAIEFKDSNMEICTLTWSMNANTWTNFFSASQNHMSWLWLNSVHNSGNSSALWALSDSWSGGSSYATRKIHQNNYGPANIEIQRNGVWWQIRSGYGTYGYAILMVNTGAGSVANLLG